MKNYKIVSALFFVAALTGCSQKLPYDLDGVEKGVVINIQNRSEPLPRCSRTRATCST